MTQWVKHCLDKHEHMRLGPQNPNKIQTTVMCACNRYASIVTKEIDLEKPQMLFGQLTPDVPRGKQHRDCLKIR